MKKHKDRKPIAVDSTVGRTKTRDTAGPTVSRVEDLPDDAATQPYAEVDIGSIELGDISAW